METLCSETSETLTIIIAQVKTIVEVLSITHSIVVKLYQPLRFCVLESAACNQKQ
uniref:Uncharacterized protein n=1 Tax=Brassica oleracea var. oleracea TaxID=109376 RepID=A0A0D3BEQ0_BRAOL